MMMGLSPLQTADGSLLKDNDGNQIYVETPNTPDDRTADVDKEQRECMVEED